MIDLFRAGFLFGCCACTAVAASSPPAYRIVRYLEQYTQPGPLVEGAPGVFYSYVVPPEVIVSVTSEGATTAIATFPPSPSTIESTPVTAANGLLYSSLEKVTGGGSASLFSISSTAGSQRIYPPQRYSLSPLAGNLPDGRLFGIAYGFSAGSWNVATADLDGAVTPVYQFPPADRPSQVLYADDGNYYGSGYTRGAPAAYFYRVTRDGSFTKIASLPYMGNGLLIQGSDGNFYGTAPPSPGCSDKGQHGVIFKLAPAGQFTVLHDFGLCGQAVVNSLIEASDERLYGSTQGDSKLFSLGKSGDYRVEHELKVSSVEGQCTCSLMQASDGVIYGAASGGGPHGSGVFFALNAGLPPPRMRAREFQPRSGPVGTKVLIWGDRLFGATVTFHGVPAAGISVSGPNYIWATVPKGASSGALTVSKPGSPPATLGNFAVQ